MRNKETIEKEIAALKAIKPRIPSKSSFGDDNDAAIDAQILVLEEQYTEEDDLHEQMFDDHVFDAALEAMQWLNEDEDMSPSESWAPLVRK